MLSRFFAGPSRLPLLLSLFVLQLCISAAQDQELVLVASSSFTMTLSPTVNELLPESLRIIQFTATAELQAAQIQNSNNTNTTISYVTNKTKVVFRDADFHVENSTSTIRFFALATVSTTSVPDGTAFRDIRLRAAEARRTALNDLVATVLHGAPFVDQIHSAAAAAAVTESSNETTTSNDVSLTTEAAAQLLAVETIDVALITPPLSTDDDSSLSSSNKLSTIDIVLICISVLIFVALVLTAVQFRRELIFSTEQEPARHAATPTVAVAPIKRDGTNTESSVEAGGTGRSFVRSVGEFKASDSASSSIASIIFPDFSVPVMPSGKPDKKPDRRIFVCDIETTQPMSLTNDPLEVVTVIPRDRQPEASSHPFDEPAEIDASDYTSSGPSGLARALAAAAVRRSGTTSQSSATSGWSTGTGNSSLLSAGTSAHDETKEALYSASTAVTTATTFSLEGLIEAALSPLSELVETQPLDPDGLSVSHHSLFNEDLVEPFESDFFHTDVTPTKSNSREVFRKNGRSDSSGSTSSDDIFNVDVESASKSSTPTSKHSEPTAISDWMKSICVVSSTSGTTDSKTSVNTSLSSMTPLSSEGVSSLERSLESPSRRSSSRTHRRRQSNPAVDEEADLAQV